MAHTTTTSSKIESPLPHWKQESNSFTGDELIDAYLRGRKDERSQNQEILMERFNTNLTLAASLSEELYREAVELELMINTVHLKAESISKFAILFVIAMDDFLSENFTKLSSKAKTIRERSKSDKFYTSFLFTPLSPTISEECITSDGYIFKYDKTK